MSKAKIKPKKYATKILARARECIPTEKKLFCTQNGLYFVRQEISLKKCLIVLCHTNACASCFEQNYDRAPPQEAFITLFQKQQKQILNFKLN